MRSTILAICVVTAVFWACAETDEDFGDNGDTGDTGDTGGTGDTGDTGDTGVSGGQTGLTGTTGNVDVGGGGSCTNNNDECCENNTILPSTAICDLRKKALYRCEDTESCGGTIMGRFMPRYCDGKNPACFGQLGEWGDWEVARTCKAHQVCNEDIEDGDDMDAGIEDDERVTCKDDFTSCDVGFATEICFDGGNLKDWVNDVEEPEPHPSLAMPGVVIGVGEGEIVNLKIKIPERNHFFSATGEEKPFEDLEVSLSHNGKTASFYNEYRGSCSVTSCTFKTNWVLPHFWGEEMAGDWELLVTDHAFTFGVAKTTVNSWCLTFLDPELTETDDGAIEAKSTLLGVSGRLENKTHKWFKDVDDIVLADQPPLLCTKIRHEYPTDVTIELVDAVGNRVVVKDKSDPELPAEFVLDSMNGEWLTGRYEIQITTNTPEFGDDPQTMNRLWAWSINYDTPCDLGELPEIDTDTGEDTDTGTGEDTDTDTGTVEDTDTDTGTVEDTDTDTGTVEDTDTDTGTVEDTDTDTGTVEDTDTDTGTVEDTDTDTGTVEDTDTDTGTVEDTDTDTGTVEDTDTDTGTVEDTDTDTGTVEDTDTGTSTDTAA